MRFGVNLALMNERYQKNDAVVTDGAAVVDVETISTSITPDPRFTGLPDYIFPGICLSDIARNLGMTLGGVSRIFNGDRRIRLFVVRAIAAQYCDGDEVRVRTIIKDRIIHRLRTSRNLAPETRNRLLANAQNEVQIILNSGDIRRAS